MQMTKTDGEFLAIDSVWSISVATKESLESTIVSIQKFPLQIRPIIINTCDSIFVKNYIDTFIYRIVKSSVVIHTSGNFSLMEKLKIAHSFMPIPRPFYFYMNNCFSVDPVKLRDAVGGFLKDTTNTLYAFNEVSPSGERIFNPVTDTFVKGNIILSRRKLDCFQKNDKINLGTVALDVTIPNKQERECWAEPELFTYTGVKNG